MDFRKIELMLEREGFRYFTFIQASIASDDIMQWGNPFLIINREVLFSSYNHQRQKL